MQCKGNKRIKVAVHGRYDKGNSTYLTVHVTPYFKYYTTTNAVNRAKIRAGIISGDYLTLDLHTIDITVYNRSNNTVQTIC